MKTALVFFVCLERTGKIEEAEKVKNEMGFQKEDVEKFWSTLPQVVNE